MAHTHEFDCKQCGAHLDSREELERHNREQHSAQAGSSRSSSSRDSSVRGAGSSDRDAETNL